MTLLAGLPADSRYVAALSEERQSTDWRGALDRQAGIETPVATTRMTLDEYLAGGGG